MSERNSNIYGEPKARNFFRKTFLEKKSFYLRCGK